MLNLLTALVRTVARTTPGSGSCDFAKLKVFKKYIRFSRCPAGGGRAKREPGNEIIFSYPPPTFSRTMGIDLIHVILRRQPKNLYGGYFSKQILRHFVPQNDIRLRTGGDEMRRFCFSSLFSYLCLCEHFHQHLFFGILDTGFTKKVCAEPLGFSGPRTVPVKSP